jgi:hypothetical protein
MVKRARGLAREALRLWEESDVTSVRLAPKAVLRSVAVLEQCGTPAAHQALEELARGTAQAVVTRQAKVTLERLKKAGEPGRK